MTYNKKKRDFSHFREHIICIMISRPNWITLPKID